MRTQAPWLLGLALATTPVPAQAQAPPPGAVRDALTAEELLGGRFPQLVHNGYFLPVGEPQAAAHRLSGTLHFREWPMSTLHPDRIWSGSGCRLFPQIDLPVVSHQGHLVPLRRGLILSGERRQSYWNVIVEPGRVWQEAADGGLSRAAFPFTLTDNQVGQARNGVATFVFDETTVSFVAVQITQETSPEGDYPRTDFRAILPVHFEAGDLAGAEEALRAFEGERAALLPLSPWSELPNAEATARLFNSGVPASDVSAAALLLDGRVYLQPVPTRDAGPFPYPEAMRHGVFSVTKTLAIGLSLFHLAERYGEPFLQERIADHVPELATHPGWVDVTFEDALDMATGTYGSEDEPAFVQFILARSRSDKLAQVRALPDALPEPGTVFNYTSTNTFALSCAVQDFVRRHEGPDADYWLMVTEAVLEPLGIPHLPLARTVEPDGSLGVPIGGWGAYPTVNEALRIAQLLQDEGMFEGRRLLHAGKVREALNRSGWHAFDAGGGNGYLHSVWQLLASAGCTFHVPAMIGRGGSYVMMLPSGASAVRFEDGHHYSITPMVQAAEAYRTSCP
jgi:CubicO group peptidase (beta-lactamase class C family)